ncbi:unnamed protein product [Allacma fusca]|uniref:Uncharacterized protein n=1 Tax=Allacma fusca TaxID=39272 RepID=A0A8J2K123_9HEXA|nr:unnamed protein product [Allacma fusca]
MERLHGTCTVGFGTKGSYTNFLLLPKVFMEVFTSSPGATFSIFSYISDETSWSLVTGHGYHCFETWMNPSWFAVFVYIQSEDPEAPLDLKFCLY